MADNSRLEGITNKAEICGDGNQPKDIEEWKGVKIEDAEVVEINWAQRDLRGSLHLEWLPPSVRKCMVNNNKLTGTLDLASLPIPMKELHLPNYICPLGEMVEWLAQGYVHSVPTSIPAHAV